MVSRINSERVVFLKLRNGLEPAKEFLLNIDPRIATRLASLLDYIANSAPGELRPSANWLPLRGTLAGLWEVRCVGPGRIHYRLFVLLDRIAAGTESNPVFVILDGKSKFNGTLLPRGVYRELEEMVDLYYEQTRGSI